MSKTAQVRVSKNYDKGTLEVSVDGVVGEQCTEITQQFESAMGLVTSQEPTRDMYATHATVVHETN